MHLTPHAILTVLLQCLQYHSVGQAGACVRTGGSDQSVADYVIHHCGLLLLLFQLHHESVQLGDPAVCGAPL